MIAITTEMIGVMIADACAVTINTINTTAGTIIININAIRGARGIGGADRSGTSRLFPTLIEFL